MTSPRPRIVGAIEGSISRTDSKDAVSSPKMVLETLFASRASLLDLKQLAPEQPQSTNLTGFYHFFWIALSFFMATTIFINYLENGFYLQGNLAAACFSDLMGVIAGELLLFAFAVITGFSVFFGTGLARSFRLLIPLGTFLIGVLFGFIRNWSGLQRSIFLLHSLSVLMKNYAFIYHHRGLTVPFDSLVVKMKHYCYFLFCPTMLYSENYPKTKR